MESTGFSKLDCARLNAFRNGVKSDGSPGLSFALSFPSHLAYKLISPDREIKPGDQFPVHIDILKPSVASIELLTDEEIVKVGFQPKRTRKAKPKATESARPSELKATAQEAPSFVSKGNRELSPFVNPLHPPGR